MSNPVTQKAIGILTGIPKISSMFDCGDFFHIPVHKLIQTEEDIAKIAYYFFPGFARGAPLTPMHGFIDSKIVSNAEELKKLFKEVKKADPAGEVLLGPALSNINSSAVYTSSGLLSIGPGNDGATGGKNSFSLQVTPIKFDASFLNEVKIKQEEAVYLESIFATHKGCYITQVRGGPALNTISADYIPADIKVKKVIVPDEDLMAWEKTVKTLKPGTVVYGNGYTLASHAAVHCILHKIPFITSAKPSAGSVLKCNEKEKINKLTKEGFRKGVSCALKMTDREDLGVYFRYCLSILHNWAYLRKHPQADVMLGACVTLFVKLCAALAFGEYRHNNSQTMFANRWREDVYSSVLSNGTKYLNKLQFICKNFCVHDWESGFGGLPWASCAWYSAAIWNNIIKLYNKDSKTFSDKDVASLVDYINRTMNLVHNNAWWFDKISDKDAMDFAAKYPGLSAFTVANIFFRVKSSADSVKKIKARLPQPKKIEVPLVLNSKGKLICAYVHPRDDAYNVKCPKCGYYDCKHNKNRTPVKSTLKIWQEGCGNKYHHSIKITQKEFKAIRKRESNNGRVYFKIIPNKGIALPTGRIIKCEGAKYDV